MAVYLRKWRNKGGQQSAWYVQFMLRGEVVHERARDPETGQQAWTKADAKTCEAKMLQRLQAGTLRPQEAPTLAAFVGKVYLPWAEMNHTPSHYQSDQWRTKVLIEHFGTLRLNEVSTFAVERFKRQYLAGNTRLKKKRSPASVNRCLQLLSKIFSMAVAAKALHFEQRPEIKLFREDNHRLRYLSVEEEQRLRPILQARAPYLHDLLIVAVNTGLRAGELFRLKKSDVDLMLNIVSVKGKGGKLRQVPIVGECRDILERIAAEKGSDFVFPSPKTGGQIDNVRKAFGTCCKLAGIVGVTPHTLRHTYGTRLAAAGVDVVTIKDLMDHADIKTTMRYVHAISANRHGAARKLAAFVSEEESRISHACNENREAETSRK